MESHSRLEALQQDAGSQKTTQAVSRVTSALESRSVSEAEQRRQLRTMTGKAV
jgi:hypothetical protein